MRTREVFFVAYEPWETMLMRDLIASLTKEDQFIKPTLIVADPFQVLHEFRLPHVRELRLQQDFDVLWVFDSIIDWQDLIRSPEKCDLLSEQSRIEKSLGLEDIRSLFDTDIFFNSYERTPYYAPLVGTSRLVAGLLPLLEVEKLLEAKNPNEIVMFFDNYLVKNYLGIWAEHSGTELKVFRGARYEDFIKLDDFFTPKRREGNQFDNGLPNNESTVASFAATKQHLYKPAQLSDALSRLELGNHSRLRAILLSLTHALKRNIAGLLITITWRAINIRQIAPWRPVYWASSFFRVLAYDFLGIVRTIAHYFQPVLLDTDSPLPKKYVLLPLHFRPEDSILTQGKGVDEIEFAEQISGLVSDVDGGGYLLVLEHPGMISDRRRKALKRLAKLANVIVLSPNWPTHLLISNSLAVITVSGTVALEAAVRGKKVFVAGLPDYLEAMNPKLPQEIGEFIRKAFESEIGEEDTSHVVNYLSRIRREGIRGEFGLHLQNDHQYRNSLARKLAGLYFEKVKSS